MESLSNVSSEEELRRLRDAGKITEKEYQELLAAMRKPLSDKKPILEKTGIAACLKRVSGNKRIPGVLWIALISLGVMVLLKLVAALKVGPLILIDVALSTVLLVGLYLGHRWAYFLTIVFTVLGTAIALSKGAGHGLAVLIGDCLVLVPVILSTDYFFFKKEANRSSGEFEK